MKDATKKATITITPGPGALDAATAKANDGDIIEIVCDEGKFSGGAYSYRGERCDRVR